MKQEFNQIKNTEGKSKKDEKINQIRNGIVTVFSLCFASLFIFFAVNEKTPEGDKEASEIASVFKESYLYDLLDLENCENKKNSEGSV